MSVSALTTLAAVRESARVDDRPKKKDVGKLPPGHEKADDSASVKDVLVKQLPTELIAPYTALSAAIVGAVATPTKKNPSPDQLAGWRWAAFIVLVVSVPLVVWWGKALKSKNWGFPWVAAIAATASAVIWAFLMPGSPLVPYLHSHAAKILIPLFIALVGAIVASGTAALLTVPKSALPQRRSRRR